jgi:hypothetical protein
MGTAADAIAWVLKNTTTVSALTSARIWHALMPKGPTLPCINFMQIGKPRRFNGMEEQVFRINCRAKTIDEADTLSRHVENIFHGTSSTGIYGTFNGFAVARAWAGDPAPIIPDPQGAAYNIPVEATLLYATSAVS